jgi:hypothetical protein
MTVVIPVFGSVSRVMLCIVPEMVADFCKAGAARTLPTCPTSTLTAKIRLISNFVFFIVVILLVLSTVDSIDPGDPVPIIHW